MSRNPKRHAPEGPSQHSLRVGGWIAFGWCAGFSSTPAFAEVCDKVAGDNWQPADGPISMLNPSVPAISEYVLIALGVILLATVRRAWAGYLAAAILSAFSLLLLTDLFSSDPVNAAAMREGCRSVATGLADLFLLLATALSLAWTGRLFRPMRTAAL